MTPQRRHLIKTLLSHPVGVCKSWETKLKSEIKSEISKLSLLSKTKPTNAIPYGEKRA